VVAQQKLAVANSLSSELNAGLQAIPAATNTSTATVAVTGTYTGSQQGPYTIALTATGNGFAFSLSGLEFSPPTNVVTRGIPQAIGKDGLYITLSTSGTLVANDSWTINVPNTASSAYLNAANAYQSALQAQTTALANAQNQIDNAKLSLTQAQASYANTSAPPTAAQAESAQASVSQAQASVQSAEMALQNTVISAPFAGQVAQLNYTQTGVQVGPSNTIATLITPQQIATISLNEVDVSKVALGDKVTMTFDAISGLTMTGTVGQVDNIGTTTQGVVNYNVQVVFDVPSDQVKSGMSVNASIITSVATDVLVVPNSAVKTGTGANAGTYVQVLGSNGQPQNVTVQTGIVNDTMTEITSGLTVGQNVVTQTVTVKAATAAKATSLLPTIGGGGAGGARASGFTGGGTGGGRAAAAPATGAGG
jgi:HlyD family secretion protein